MIVLPLERAVNQTLCWTKKRGCFHKLRPPSLLCLIQLHSTVQKSWTRRRSSSITNNYKACSTLSPPAAQYPLSTGPLSQR
eukprot:9067995-Ditylum_brightwellii.AAC.1